MKPATPQPLATARCDASGRLVSASEPLAGLQRRCGGTLPGAIAIPALAELVAEARHYRMRLARAIFAVDGEAAIDAWIEVTPWATADPVAGEPGDGYAISVLGWQARPLAAGDALGRASALSHHAEIDRALAEFSARLDAGQRVLTVACEAPDLAALAQAMRAGTGRLWTQFVTLPGTHHHQPLHWRLLDGAEVRIACSARSWRARLFAQSSPGAEPSGFELCLTSNEPPPPASDNTPPAPTRARGDIVVGREIAPVLRQPIARIIANAETIRARLAGPLGDDYSSYAGDIVTAGQHLLELVDDLADLEVVESAGFSTAPDAIDLADVARRAAGILSVRARERGITLVLPEEGASMPATAEFRRVLQVLLNLIGNAIRYTPEGSLVSLLLANIGGMACITVADEGAGLSPEDAEKMFDKFERLGRSGDGGTGLGLYISRRLARAMGGDLTVASEPGEGARFTLAVPTG